MHEKKDQARNEHIDCIGALLDAMLPPTEFQASTQNHRKLCHTNQRNIYECSSKWDFYNTRRVLVWSISILWDHIFIQQ